MAKVSSCLILGIAPVFIGNAILEVARTGKLILICWSTLDTPHHTSRRRWYSEIWRT